MSNLARKLRIAPGAPILVLNAPEGYDEALAPLPEGVAVHTQAKGRFQFVHLFAKDIAELEQLASEALGALEYDGVFWVSYPKVTSALNTDLSRDHGWDVLRAQELRPVSQVSFDGTWSALRFRPAQEVKSRG